MLRVIPPSVYLLLLLSPWSVPVSAAVTETHQPNILLLLADDLGYNDSAIYQDVYGQTAVAAMPNLESFAAEGLRFSRFYTESTCSASRAALLSGQYPARHGFIPVARGLSPDLLTLPEYLQTRGYVTHHTGKWHVGEFNREALPAAQGFDTSFGFLSQWMLQGPGKNGAIQLKAPTYYNPWLRDEKGNLKQYPGHLEDLLTAHTVQRIRQHTQQPWFIYHAFLAPHAPLEPSAQFAAQFPDTAEGKHRAMLAQLDHNLGLILSALKESGQWDNTIIIFASDNGSQKNGSQKSGSKQGSSNAPFTGGKAAYDEGGIRAPLVIKWQGDLAAKPQLRSDAVSLLDIYASLRVALGQKTMEGLDGRAALLPGAVGSSAPSLRVFYTFDAFSIFNPTGAQRLLREWHGDSFQRSELFYYDMTALPVPSVESWWQRLFSNVETIEEKYFADFLRWRDQVRQVPVKVTSLAGAGSETAYKISGSDFLRSPVNPAWAMAFSVTADSSGQKKILLAQKGIMEVTLEQQSLRATVHGMEVRAEPIEAGQCYTVVLSGAFYDHYSTVQDNLLPSQLHLIINGVLRDSATSPIESLAEVAVSTPQVAKGISAPRFFTTQLLPDDKPLPSHLAEASEGLCPAR